MAISFPEPPLQKYERALVAGDLNQSHGTSGPSPLFVANFDNFEILLNLYFSVLFQNYLLPCNKIYASLIFRHGFIDVIC